MGLKEIKERLGFGKEENTEEIKDAESSSIEEFEEPSAKENIPETQQAPIPPEPKEILSMDTAFENEKIPEISENITFKLQLLKNMVGENLSPELIGKLFTVVRMAPLGGEDDAIKAAIDLAKVIPKNISQEKQNYLRAILPNIVRELQKDLGYYKNMEKGDNLKYLQRFQIFMDRISHEIMDIIKPDPVLEEPSTAEWDKFHEEKARFEESQENNSEQAPIIQMKPKDDESEEYFGSEDQDKAA